MCIHQRIEQVNRLRKKSVNDDQFLEQASEHQKAIEQSKPASSPAKSRCTFSKWAGGR
ncbi:hypothetical protein [Vibrio sp. SCSIO 43136]|uniref:hypothetical protein n=1 Tax=Vibrio sp. SCSIO 43136 TaxID=2819101 RepID=UPI00207527A3|nr:hypothetical protein [Vibrio sp. SCSIO 43136]USD68108.1 hypothetical protein J4N39_18205 [Vibrio sp. SCSIO 43136]